MGYLASSAGNVGAVPAFLEQCPEHLRTEEFTAVATQPMRTVVKLFSAFSRILFQENFYYEINAYASLQK